MECGICYEEYDHFYFKVCCNELMCVDCRIHLRNQECPFCRAVFFEPFEEENKGIRRLRLFTKTERKRIRRLQKLQNRQLDIDNNRVRHEKNKRSFITSVIRDY